MQSPKYKLPKQEYLDKLNWNALSQNPNAIHLLEKYPEKIYWKWLSYNPNAIHLLEKYPEKVEWEYLLWNPNAVYLLRNALLNEPEKIHWRRLSENENLMDIIRQYDYNAMRQSIQPLAEELAKWINNPRKYGSEEDFLKRQCELGFLELEDIECEMY